MKRSAVQRRIDGVDVFLVQLLPEQLDGLAEALEVDDFPLPEEADDVIDVGVVAETEDIVVGHPGFLLGGQILGQVGDGVALDADARGIPRRTGGGGGVDPGRVVHKIGHKPAFLHLRVRELPRELMYNGADHLQVSQLFGTYLRVKMEPEERGAIHKRGGGRDTACRWKREKE